MLLSVQQQLVVLQWNNRDLQHSLVESISLESRELQHEYFIPAGLTFWIMNPIKGKWLEVNTEAMKKHHFSKYTATCWTFLHVYFTRHHCCIRYMCHLDTVAGKFSKKKKKLGTVQLKRFPYMIKTRSLRWAALSGYISNSDHYLSKDLGNTVYSFIYKKRIILGCHINSSGLNEGGAEAPC